MACRRCDIMQQKRARILGCLAGISIAVCMVSYIMDYPIRPTIVIMSICAGIVFILSDRWVREENR
jgi:uncharacterized membrane protein YccC